MDRFRAFKNIYLTRNTDLQMGIRLVPKNIIPPVNNVAGSGGILKQVIRTERYSEVESTVLRLAVGMGLNTRGMKETSDELWNLTTRCGCCNLCVFLPELLLDEQMPCAVRALPYTSNDGKDIIIDLFTKKHFPDYPYTDSNWRTGVPTEPIIPSWKVSRPYDQQAVNVILYALMQVVQHFCISTFHLLLGGVERFIETGGPSDGCGTYSDILFRDFKRFTTTYLQDELSDSLPAQFGTKTDWMQTNWKGCRHSPRGRAPPKSTSFPKHPGIAQYADGWTGPVQGQIYRAEETSFGARCTNCHRKNLHYLANDVLHDMTRNDERPIEDPTDWLELSFCVRHLTRDMEADAVVGITATSPNRLDDFEKGLPAGFDGYIVLVSDLETARKITSCGMRPIICHTPDSHLRALGNWRMMAAAAVEGWKRAIVMNGRYDVSYPSSMAWWPNPEETCRSPMMLGVFPAIASAVGWLGGSVFTPLVVGYGLLNRWAAIYGAEEFLIAFHEDPAVEWFGSGPWEPLRNIESDLFFPAPYRMIARVGGNISRWTMSSVTRMELVMFVNHALNLKRNPTPRTLSAAISAPWVEKDEGVFTELTPRDVSAAVPRTRVSMTAQGLLRAIMGPVIFMPIGSHGDVVPVRALARHLATMGLDTYLCPLTTPEEGKQLLKDLEKGRTLRGAPVFIRALAVALSAPGTKVGVTEMPGLDVCYSLQPPRSVIHPPRFDLGLVPDTILSTFFGSKVADFRIGSYKSPNHVPRSANGETFLKQTKWEPGRPHKAGIVWGSSSVPMPKLHNTIPIVNSNHEEVFKLFDVIYCHGGAGTVQTIAASGARAVSLTRTLDRNYKDPGNAGFGTTFEIDPDRILLGFARRYPLIFLIYARKSWLHAKDALYWFIWLYFSSILWAIVVFGWIMIRSTKGVTLGPSLVSSILLTTLGEGVTQSTLGRLVSPIASQLVEAGLEFANIEKWDIFRKVSGFLLHSLTSSVGIVLILDHGLLWGVFFHSIITIIEPGIRAFMALILALIAVPATPDDEDMAIIRFNLCIAKYTPVLHVGLINRERTHVYELRFAHEGGSFGDEALIAMWPYREVEGLIFEFPTLLKWEEVKRYPRTRGRYSLFFNCQVALAGTMGRSISLLGIGGVVLYLCGLLAAMTISLGIVFLALILCMVLFVPDLFGFVTPEYLGTGMWMWISNVESWVRVLGNVDLPFIQKTIAIVNSPMVGFGNTQQERTESIFALGSLSFHSAQDLIKMLHDALVGTSEEIGRWPGKTWQWCEWLSYEIHRRLGPMDVYNRPLTTDQEAVYRILRKPPWLDPSIESPHPDNLDEDDCDEFDDTDIDPQRKSLAQQLGHPTCAHLKPEGTCGCWTSLAYNSQYGLCLWGPAAKLFIQTCVRINSGVNLGNYMGSLARGKDTKPEELLAINRLVDLAYRYPKIPLANVIPFQQGMYQQIEVRSPLDICHTVIGMTANSLVAGDRNILDKQKSLYFRYGAAFGQELFADENKISGFIFIFDPNGDQPVIVWQGAPWHLIPSFVRLHGVRAFDADNWTKQAKGLGKFLSAAKVPSKLIHNAMYDFENS